MKHPQRHRKAKANRNCSDLKCYKCNGKVKYVKDKKVK